MALRKFSKYMKIMTVLIILSVVLSAAYAGYSYVTSYLNTKKHVIMTIDGIKIYKEDYDNEYKTLVSNLDSIYMQNGVDKIDGFKKVPEDIIKEMTVSSVINKSIYKILAKEMKIEVSNADINSSLSEIEEQYNGKENLALVLAQRNLTLADLRENIKDSLIHDKILEKFKQQLKPTDEELEKIYARAKYTDFDSREFDEVKSDVEQLYYEQNLDLILNSRIEELFEKLTISTKDKSLKETFEKIKKVELQVEDIKIYRKNMLGSYIIASLNTKTGYDENIEKNVIESKKAEIQALINKEKKILEKGIKPLDGLTPTNRIQSTLQKYYYYLVDTYNPSEAEMKQWFEAKKEFYDVENSVSGEILGISYQHSEKSTKDLELTEKKAKETLKTITKDNFTQKAMELSTDPGSAKNGGDLGWVSLSSLVPEFSVVRKAEKGSIIGPVKTQFGYHIIYVVDKKEAEDKYNLKHILLPFEISNETKNKVKEEVLEIEKQIKAGKLTWKQIASDKTGKYKKFDIQEQFSETTKNSSLPNVGYNEKIMEDLFNIGVNDFIDKDLGDAFVIIQKTQEIPYKKANFEELKDRIRLEIATSYANKEIEK